MSTEVIISEYQRSINKKSNWHRISALSCLKNSGIEDVVTDAEHFSFMEGLLYLDRKELLTKIDSQYIQPNRLLISDIEFLLIDGWPLIIATDGGADKFESNSRHSIHQSRASASVVIFHPPSLPFAQYINATEEEQTNILSQNLFPWKARASSLPKKNLRSSDGQCPCRMLCNHFNGRMASTKHSGATHYGFRSRTFSIS